eukprot:CAMPEP_0201135522 /NCGR_PEP_ID=MMETSP0850-20130426/54360_1 /ASSEMBLY_ACC=CAM_ASM_000622 /TAXON_ID=183588 /ORGANISM="Pseudo-nitzschia fraudulenta, Strain WWA7" /LENGTH=203 /DNA_ID=CAMNT_0047406693 /DNA_START=85 /DNA_END=696 /DNA_ORIENTATION=-
MKFSLFSPLFLSLIGTVSVSADPSETFVYESKPVPERAEINCDIKYQNMADICSAAQKGTEHTELEAFCDLLDFVSFTDGSNLGSNDPYTVFAATNSAVDRFFTNVWGSREITKSALIPILSGSIIEAKLSTEELICGNRPNTWAKRDPVLKCKADIADNPISYVKGNKNKKDFPPKFVDPAEPIETCTTLIYTVTDLIYPSE